MFRPDLISHFTCLSVRCAYYIMLCNRFINIFMWKPSIPAYLPCRQATAAEQKTLKGYLLRDLARQAETVTEEGETPQPLPDPNREQDNDPVMAYEIAAHEVLSLVLNSILVVFDWHYYQTSPLVPVHESTQAFAKVLCVFWNGNPANADVFTWEHDGTFQRLVNDYQPERLLQQGTWQTTSHLF